MNINYPKKQMQDSEEKLVRNAKAECEVRLQVVTSRYLGEYQHWVCPPKRPLPWRKGQWRSECSTFQESTQKNRK